MRRVPGQIRGSRKGSILIDLLVASSVAILAVGGYAMVIQVQNRNEATATESRTREFIRRGIVRRFDAGLVHGQSINGVLPDSLTDNFSLTNPSNVAGVTTPTHLGSLGWNDGLYSPHLWRLDFVDPAGRSVEAMPAFLLTWDVTTNPGNRFEDADRRDSGKLLPPVDVFPATSAELLAATWPISNFIRHPVPSEVPNGEASILFRSDGLLASLASAFYAPNAQFQPWNYPRRVSALRKYVFTEKWQPSDPIFVEHPWPDLIPFRPSYVETDINGVEIATDWRLNIFNLLGTQPVKFKSDPMTVNWSWLYHQDTNNTVPADPAQEAPDVGTLSIPRNSFWNATSTYESRWQLIPRNQDYTDKLITADDVFGVEPVGEADGLGGDGANLSGNPGEN